MISRKHGRKFMFGSVVMVLYMMMLFSPAHAEDVTITFSTWWMGIPELEDMTLEWVSEFETAHPGVKVEILSGLHSGNDQLKTMMATGTGPDVFFWDMYQAADYIGNGWAMKLDPLLARDGIKITDYYPGVMKTWQAWWSDGGTHALPVFAIDFNIIANAAMFAEAGLAIPPNDWTVDEFVSAAQRLTKRVASDTAGAQWGISERGSYFSSVLGGLQTLVWNYGGEILSEDGRKLLYDSPEALQAAELAVDLHREYDVVGGIFENLEAAMHISDASVAFRTNPDIEFTLIRVPKAERQTANMLSHAVGVNAATPHLNEAWAFAKFVAGPVGQRIIAKYAFMPALRDHEALETFLGTTPPNILDVSAMIPEPGIEVKSDPTFYNWYAGVKAPWWNAVLSAAQGEADIVNVIREELPKWQSVLDEFWREIDGK